MSVWQAKLIPVRIFLSLKMDFTVFIHTFDSEYIPCLIGDFLRKILDIYIYIYMIIFH